MVHKVEASSIDAGAEIIKAKLPTMKQNWEDAKSEMKTEYANKVPQMVKNYGEAFPNATIAKRVYEIKSRNMAKNFSDSIDKAKFDLNDAQITRWARKTKRGLGL